LGFTLIASLFVSLYNPNLHKSIKLDPVLAMQKVAGRVNGKANSLSPFPSLHLQLNSSAVRDGSTSKPICAIRGHIGLLEQKISCFVSNCINILSKQYVLKGRHSSTFTELQREVDVGIIQQAATITYLELEEVKCEEKHQ